ncbi:MAG TPA: hypothetical protein VGM01_09345 [Ktedonobacteraceae bacterium]
MRQGKTWHTYTRDVVDGKISDALAGDPYLTPVCRVLLHTGFPPLCYLPIRRLYLTKLEESSRAQTKPRGIPGAERLSAHSR